MSQTQEQIWNAIAEEWQKVRSKPIKEVIEFLKDKSGNLLDLGCGSGRHFPEKWKGIIYGVDFSEEMLKFAEKKAKNDKINLILKKANANSLPFEDNFFDSAIFISALHCIESEQGRISSLRELFRVLKPKAQALISVWSKSHIKLKGKPKEASVAWTAKNEKYQRYYYLYDKDELISQIKQAGFKIIASSEDKNIWITAEKP